MEKSNDPEKVNTALDLLGAWYNAKIKSEHHEIVERWESTKRKWRKNQIFFKTKGLVAHDQHLTSYPRGYDC